MSKHALARILLILENTGTNNPVETSVIKAFQGRVEVLKARDVELACELCTEKHFDIALLCLDLSTQVDLEAISIISNKVPDLPILVFGDRHDEDIALKAVNHGAQDYLPTDIINGQVLERVIRFAIERKHHEEALHARDVTIARLEKKKTENRLRSERDFNAALIETVGALIVVLDRDGVILRFNRACENSTGYSANEVLGKHVWDMLLTPEERDPVKNVFMQLQAGHFPNTHQNYWLTKQGGRRLISWSNTAIIDSKGDVECVIATGIDVTERDNAELALQKSEQSYQIMTENIPAIVYRTSLSDGRTTQYFNELITTMTGYTEDELSCGKVCGCENLIVPEDREKTERIVNKSIRDGIPYEVEYRIKHKDGTIHHFFDQGRPTNEGDSGPKFIDGTIIDITKLKQSKLALKESESMFRDLTEKSLVGVYLVQDSRILYVNPRFGEIFGYDPNELIGKTTLDLVLPDDRKRVEEKISERLHSNEASINDSFRGLTKQGKTINIEVFGSSTVHKGKPAIIGTLLDITERKRFSEALEMERRLFVAGPTIIFKRSAKENWPVEYVSPNILSLLGYHPEEFISGDISFGKIIHKDDLPSVAQTTDAETKAGSPHFELEYRVAKKNGGYRWVHDLTVIVRDSKKNVTNFNGYLVDITQRIQVEQQILQTSMDGYLLISKDGEIIETNPAYCRMLGFNVDEIVSKNILDIDTHTSKSKFKNLVKKIIENGSGSFETQHLHKNGKLIDLEVSITSVPSSDDFIAAAFVRDITFRKSEENRARQRLVELAHASRLSTMGEMASEIAHELNQPLSAINTYSDAASTILSNSSFQDKDLNESLQGISKQAVRAGDIIKSLRNFVGKQETEACEADVNDLINDVIKLTSTEARHNGAEIELRLAVNLPSIFAERILIEQVVLNIVRNAIEAMREMEPGRRKITVKTYLNSTNQIEVNISDTGPGIAQADPNKIFESFLSTKSNGMGMGLSICRSIIDAHGGKLWTTPNSPHGAIFSFTLPLSEKEP